MRWLRQLQGFQAPHLGLHIHEIYGLREVVVGHHLARRRSGGVRWLQRREVVCVGVRAREGQPVVEELGLQDGELALEQRYLSSCQDTDQKQIQRKTNQYKDSGNRNKKKRACDNN